ncbi:MAG: hypothetical protein GX591_15670 [Planctomycetes bacterium]|nr:hypothetical protein [Planctomycetota bacterium]
MRRQNERPSVWTAVGVAALLLSAAGCGGAGAAADWGRIEVREGEAVLENSVFVCRLGSKVCGKGEGGADAWNDVITELTRKDVGIDQAGAQLDGVWMAFGRGRGELVEMKVTADGPDRRTLHVEWRNEFGPVVQDYTIYPDSPVLRIDYHSYGVNVVDIGRPGGARKGTYVFHGAEAWRDYRRTITEPAWREHENPHERLTDELYPAYPFPIHNARIWKGLDVSPLTYKGFFIMGIYDADTGAGYGRVAPAASIDTLKLLFDAGFELFPCFGRPHEPYTQYLFTVTGGAGEILSLGKRIADAAAAGAPVPRAAPPQGDEAR